MTVRTRTFSQAPRAVRSAGGRRWDGALPAGTAADWAFHADKCDALRLTVQVDRLRHISTAAAVRAVVRVHSSPPSCYEHCYANSPPASQQIILRYESRTSFSQTHRSPTIFEKFPVPIFFETKIHSAALLE